MKPVLSGEDPLSRAPKVQIGKNLVNFFGDNLPAFPSSTSADLSTLLKSRLYTQAVGLVDRLITTAPVESQLDMLTIKIASLLATRAVPSAISTLSNFFGSADLAEVSQWKGSPVPVKLRILSCLAHHYNGDSIRALGGLYRVLKNTPEAQADDVIITLAKLQASLGDIEEVGRLLIAPRFTHHRNHLLQIAGYPCELIPGFTAMACGDYATAAEEFREVGDLPNEAIASFYNCEHAKCVDLLESCIRIDPISRSNSGLLNNLFAVYGFYKESYAERKISTVNEVTRFYCPEAGLFIAK